MHDRLPGHTNDDLRQKNKRQSPKTHVNHPKHKHTSHRMNQSDQNHHMRPDAAQSCRVNLNHSRATSGQQRSNQPKRTRASHQINQSSSKPSNEAEDSTVAHNQSQLFMSHVKTTNATQPKAGVIESINCRFFCTRLLCRTHTFKSSLPASVSFGSARCSTSCPGANNVR
jgi:hypothetical protein